MTLLRLLLLVVALVPVFSGFGLPFFVPGWPGLAYGGALVICGSALLWVIHQRTQTWLDADTGANRWLKSDGESLLRDPADRDARDRVDPPN